MQAEELKPGGDSHHLLEQLYRCRILSECAERQWGTCRVEIAPAPGHLKSLLLVGMPFMVRQCAQESHLLMLLITRRLLEWCLYWDVIKSPCSLIHSLTTLRQASGHCLSM